MLSSAQIADAVRTAIPTAAVSLRPDALEALRAAAARERSPRGRAVLEQLLENACIAERDSMPLCQDTGSVWVRVELGAEECVCGDLHAAIDRAVAEAYREAHLRMSMVRDALLDRTNTSDNTPAFVDVVLGARAGSGATVHVMLKGGGSDNASRVEMLSPSAGIDGIRRLVLETVEEKATGACPPLVVGVGVGATFDKVAGLSKKALLREIGSAPADPLLAELEAELLAAINFTGIGPAGLGGDTTALGVHIETAPCHIAALPVAVNLGLLGDPLGERGGARVSDALEPTTPGGGAPGAGAELANGNGNGNGNGGGYGRLLKNKRFRRLWYAQFVSGIGDWLVIGLLMPLVFTLSGGSSFAVAGILIAKIIPALVLSSFTGVLVDHFDRRKVMITADVVRMLLALILLGTKSLWVIYAVVLLMETASLFFWPARNSLIPYLVEEDDIIAANGLSYTTQQASMLVGLSAVTAILAVYEAIIRGIVAAQLPIVSRLVGVFQITLLGARASVVLDSLTFLFSAIMVSLIAVKARPAESTGPLDLSLLGRDVVESFQFLRQHVELRSLLVVVGLAILGGGAIIPVGVAYIAVQSGNLVGNIPIFAGIPLLTALAGSRQTFVLVCLAIGMVFGALVVPEVERRLSLQLLFAGSVATFGVAMLGFASVRQYWIACLFIVLAGVCIATLTVAGQSYIVRTTTDSIRGRVFTAQESVVRVSLLLSMVVMAPLGDIAAKIIRSIVSQSGVPYDEVYLTGPRITLWVASLIVLGAAVYAFRTLEWRRAEQGEPVTGELAEENAHA